MNASLTNAAGELLRRPLVSKVLERRSRELVITGLGAPTYDVAAAGGHDRDFYFWGAMGLAAVSGLGLAMARPGDRVIVVTGDGDMMMGIGSLATIARVAPENLAILVLDNASFGETGEQPSLTAGPADLAAMARGAGIPSVFEIRREEDIPAASAALYGDAGPVVCVARVARGEDPKVLPNWDGPSQVSDFQAALGIRS